MRRGVESRSFVRPRVFLLLLCCYSFVYLLTSDENVNTQREETENTKDKTASSAIHDLPNRHTGGRRDGETEGVQRRREEAAGSFCIDRADRPMGEKKQSDVEN